MNVNLMNLSWRSYIRQIVHIALLWESGAPYRDINVALHIAFGPVT